MVIFSDEEAKILGKQEWTKIRSTAKHFTGYCHNDLGDYYSFCLQNIIDGLWLEFGVWMGATIDILAKKTDPNKVYGFDSFEGLPEDWVKSPGEILSAGHFKTNRLPKVAKNVELIAGWFDQTLDGFLLEHTQQVAVLHIDSDLYSSAKTVLSKLANRLVPGTIILFDELLGYPMFYLHEMKAWLETVQDYGFTYQYLAYTQGPQVGVRII